MSKTLGTGDRAAIVRRTYAELWSAGRYEIANDVFDPDYVNIDPATPTPGGCVRGPEGMVGLVRSFREGVGDLKMEIVAQVIDGEQVVSRWVASGTHTGTLMGLPPSARALKVEGVTISSFRGDRVVEDRAFWDTLGLLRQLGAIPS